MGCTTPPLCGLRTRTPHTPPRLFGKRALSAGLSRSREGVGVRGSPERAEEGRGWELGARGTAAVAAAAVRGVSPTRRRINNLPCGEELRLRWGVRLFLLLPSESGAFALAVWRLLLCPSQAYALSGRALWNAGAGWRERMGPSPGDPGQLGVPWDSPAGLQGEPRRSTGEGGLFPVHTHARRHWPGRVTPIFLPCSFQSFDTRLVLPVRAEPWSPKRIPTLVPPVGKKVKERLSGAPGLRVIVVQMLLPGPPAAPQSLKRPVSLYQKVTSTQPLSLNNCSTRGLATWLELLGVIMRKSEKMYYPSSFLFYFQSPSVSGFFYFLNWTTGPINGLRHPPAHRPPPPTTDTPHTQRKDKQV
ncbi:uncharacterized protein LOC101035470 [Saimiri boliviensis]|uniref:uncharacterized protein LOC101035470 n=1 Tax=Saimiri boliviensis TaxID=27679 RepID=UPI003D77179A